MNTDLLAYPLAAGLGFVAAQAPNMIRLYWRYIAAPTALAGTVAIVTHTEPLFALVVHLWITASLGVVLGMFVGFGPWRPGGGGDDEGFDPRDPDPEDHRPEAEPVIDEVAPAVTTPAAEGLDLWADFDAAPPAPAEPDRMLPVDTTEGATLRAGRSRGRRSR